MRIITMLMGLLASAFLVTSCSTQCKSPCQADNTPAPCHQDVKGERG